MTTTSFAPSSRLPRRLPRDDGTITAVVADPDTTTTTTTTTLSIPSPLPTSPQPGAFAPGGASSPSLLAGCISIAAFASAFVLICVWCRFRGSAGSDAINRFLDRVLPARFRRRTVDDDDEEVQEVQEQEEREGGVGGGGGPPGPPEPEEQVHIWRRLSSRRSRRSQTRASRRRKARPEMFDAWIEKTDDASRWEAGGSLVSRRGSLNYPVSSPIFVFSFFRFFFFFARPRVFVVLCVIVTDPVMFVIICSLCPRRSFRWGRMGHRERMRRFLRELELLSGTAFMRRKTRRSVGVCLCRRAKPSRQAAVPCKSPSFFKCLHHRHHYHHQVIIPRPRIRVISAFGVSWSLGLSRHHGLESTRPHEKAKKLLHLSRAG